MLRLENCATSQYTRTHTKKGQFCLSVCTDFFKKAMLQLTWISSDIFLWSETYIPPFFFISFASRPSIFLRSSYRSPSFWKDMLPERRARLNHCWPFSLLLSRKALALWTWYTRASSWSHCSPRFVAWSVLFYTFMTIALRSFSLPWHCDYLVLNVYTLFFYLLHEAVVWLEIICS